MCYLKLNSYFGSMVNLSVYISSILDEMGLRFGLILVQVMADPEIIQSPKEC